ncbi:hypothetical protein L1049_001096 [Liquidambar formosana]|uniref:ULTRAPETALA1/2 SAND domain-containing protein n=1 Tax=Liquidambar formosana TaxID=63359 RepID=A0AAP0R599_LIQFO
MAQERRRGTEMVVRGEGATLFTDQELKDISGLRKGPDNVEVTCGCTRRKFGDAVGKLRVFADGRLEIKCECNPSCQEGNEMGIGVYACSLVLSK